MANKRKIRWNTRRNDSGMVELAYTNEMCISRAAGIFWTAEVWTEGNDRWYYYIDSPNGFVVPDRYAGKTLEQAQARAEAMLIECANKAINQIQKWRNG